MALAGYHPWLGLSFANDGVAYRLDPRPVRDVQPLPSMDDGPQEQHFDQYLFRTGLLFLYTLFFQFLSSPPTNKTRCLTLCERRNHLLREHGTSSHVDELFLEPPRNNPEVLVQRNPRLSTHRETLMILGFRAEGGVVDDGPLRTGQIRL